MARYQFDRIIARIPGLKVAVLGDAMLDAYTVGNSSNLAVEAPVPVVKIDREFQSPGGAANSAVNVAALGAHSVLFSAVGDDLDGNLLRERLHSFGVDTRHLLHTPARTTIAKRRIFANYQTIIRLDSGTTDNLAARDEQELCRRLRERLREFDALIISDYACGTITPLLLDTLAWLSRAVSLIITADSKDPRRLSRLRLTAVKPNYREFTRLLDLPERTSLKDRFEQVQRHGPRLLDLLDSHIAAITLDRSGALVFERDRPPYRTFSRQVSDNRAVGAGDTYIAAFTLALAADAPVTEAAEFAASASHIAINKDGTAPCYLDELLDRNSHPHKHILTSRQLAELLDQLRHNEKQVVFTNGCFDILHRGHVTYLNQAKNLGDVLIVGVNTDDSIRRLKGEDRPINRLEDRINVLSALSCVDYIIPFTEDSPENIITAVRPDIVTKGGNYTEDELPEAPLVRRLGGRVEILPYIDSQSTSGLINRIRQTREMKQ